jgi:hypothetical protein
MIVGVSNSIINAELAGQKRMSFPRKKKKKKSSNNQC